MKELNIHLLKSKEKFIEGRIEYIKVAFKTFVISQDFLINGMNVDSYCQVYSEEIVSIGP